MTKKNGKQTRGEKLLEDFDEAAQSWGWEADQGSRPGVDRSEKRYNKSKKELLKYLKWIEGAHKRLLKEKRSINA